MKREGTLSATASGTATPTESIPPISRSTSVDGLNVLPLARSRSLHQSLAASERAHQEQHAQQLIEAVAVAKLEREEQERKDKELSNANGAQVAMQDGGVGSGDESQWEDIDEEGEEQDLADCGGVVIRRANGKRAEDIV